MGKFSFEEEMKMETCKEYGENISKIKEILEYKDESIEKLRQQKPSIRTWVDEDTFAEIKNLIDKSISE